MNRNSKKSIQLKWNTMHCYQIQITSKHPNALDNNEIHCTSTFATYWHEVLSSTIQETPPIQIWLSNRLLFMLLFTSKWCNSFLCDALAFNFLECFEWLPTTEENETHCSSCWWLFWGWLVWTIVLLVAVNILQKFIIFRNFTLLKISNAWRRKLLWLFSSKIPINNHPYDYYDQFINDTKFDKYDFFDQFINDNNDPYYYYDLPLTLNLSYFPVSFPESSTRDPYLGETLLWNEKSWIIFRLGHYFNRFRLINMRFWETFGARRLECKAVNVHEIWAREGSTKKRLRDWGGALKVSSADQHQLLKSRNQQILMRSRWILGTSTSICICTYASC